MRLAIVVEIQTFELKRVFCIIIIVALTECGRIDRLT